MDEIAGERVPNPISEIYADIARSFLELHAGREITPEIVDYLSNLITATNCELVGLGEVAAIFGVSKQRISQLKDKGVMPDRAADLASGPVWLARDVVKFGRDRPKTGGRRPKKQS